MKSLCNACGLRYARAQSRKLKKVQKEREQKDKAAAEQQAWEAAQANGSGLGSHLSIDTSGHHDTLGMSTSNSQTPTTTSGYYGLPTAASEGYSTVQPLPPLPKSTAAGQEQNQNYQYPNFVFDGNSYAEWNTTAGDQSHGNDSQNGQ